MSAVTRILTSSLGKKYLMSFTGFFLLLFLTVHLAGNFIIFAGETAFNEYSKLMSDSLFIKINEVMLFTSLMVHIIQAVILSVKNKSARPQSYHKSAAGENSSFFSRTMPLTGALILIFLVVHLRSFFVEQKILETSKSMYAAVENAFSNETYVLFYIIAMVLLSYHLHHGFQSAFQSLGLNHKRYTPFLKKIGIAYSILVPSGFISIPIYFYFIR